MLIVILKYAIFILSVIVIWLILIKMTITFAISTIFVKRSDHLINWTELEDD